MVADRGADHLHVSEYVGDTDEHQQHREQRGPEPAVLQRGERLQRQHHRAHPHTLPQHGHRHCARHGRAIRPHRLRGGRGQLQDAGTVRHAAEGEHEEDREDDPAEVAEDYDAGVADEAVPELVVSAIGGEHAEPELQGEDDVCGGLQPGRHAGEGGPLRPTAAMGV